MSVRRTIGVVLVMVGSIFVGIFGERDALLISCLIAGGCGVIVSLFGLHKD